MNNQRIELMDGVFLTLIPTDKFKTNCLSLSLLRPLCRQEAALNALLPDVLVRGCGLCPDMGALSAWLDQRYGAGVQTTVRKKGEVQAVGFFLDYISADCAPSGEELTEDICALLGSLLLDPALENGCFQKDYVEGEKVNLVNAIASMINEKRTYASLRLQQEMFRQEPYGVSRYGDRADAEAITPESLYDHYRKVLRTSRIEIIFTGKTDETRLRTALEKALGGLPRGEIVPVGTSVRPAPETPRTVQETMDLTQGKLVMGFRTGVTAGDPDYPAMVLMNGVFGGTVGSKLFLNVRERLSLCYYASSGLDRFKGVMLVSSGVDTANYKKAREEILAQLEACKEGQVTEEELLAAGSSLITSLKTGEDSPYQMDDFVLGQEIGGLTYTAGELAEAIGRVTLPELQAAARKVRLDTVFFLKGEEEE